MKRLRVGAPGDEQPAVRTGEGRLLGLSSITSDVGGAFLASDGVDRARAAMVPDPGDVINTGTPAGVALGLPGTPYLRPGDTVELAADGLGAQRQTFAQV
ncbi:fumarylacetoacetate hydrolase family protein [Streptomyces sp. DH10]|nr:fumarylacetoacetate hydrolase family protein [Streptomyces sp. DH10]MDG9714797.1 fumarylacetoacetate hydrolase family protein [Streptomyces sp. DH10]